jgi:hypothetical protein
MEISIEKYFDIKVEDGIVNVILLCEHLDEQIIEMGIKRRLALTKDKSYPMFSDIRKIKSITRGGRQRLAQKDAGYGTKVVAFLINSKVQEVLFAFFNILHKAPAPSKTFTNKEKALEWLKQYK